MARTMKRMMMMIATTRLRATILALALGREGSLRGVGEGVRGREVVVGFW